MKICVAGSDTRGSEAACIKHNVPKLYSILNEKKLIERWDDDNFLIVDSGAHSWNKAHITKVGMKRKTKLKPAAEFIEFYFDFIMKHKHKKLYFIEFDVYGDLKKKKINKMFKKMRDMDMTAKFIRVYHPILDGGTMEVLQEWVEDGHEYICVANDSADQLDKVFAITQDKCRVHGLAMTKTSLIEKYPFYSVDSTSPLSTVIFGRYSRPIMGFNEREDIRAMKSIECFDDDWARLEKAVIETKLTQDYITELWKRKGVTWTDLYPSHSTTS